MHVYAIEGGFLLPFEEVAPSDVLKMQSNKTCEVKSSSS